MRTINKTPVSRYLPFIICFLGAAFYVYDFVVRVMPSAMTRELMLAFNIHASGLGILSSLFFWGYAPMQIPAGLLFDRFGTRKVLIFVVTLCGIATAIFGMTETYTVALIARFMVGFTTSFAYIGALLLGAMWFDKKHFTIYIGIVQMLSAVGAMIGQSPLAALTLKIGWHNATYVIAAAGIILGFFVWLFVVESDQARRLRRLRNQSSHISLKPVLTHAQNWWTFTYGWAMWAPITIFASLWGVPFFEEQYHLSKVHTTAILALIWVGVAIGGPFFGWLSAKLKRRNVILYGSAILGFVCSLPMIYVVKLPESLLWVCLFLFGVACVGGLTVIWGVVDDSNSKKVLGTAIGFTNIGTILGGITFQPMVGFILQKHWDGQIVNGTHYYPLSAYHMALAIIPICFAASFIISAFLVKETYCKPLHPKN